MWRRFRFVAMLLVLGAVVNVAVAWGAVMLAGHSRREEWIFYSAATTAPLLVCHREWGTECVSYMGDVRFLIPDGAKSIQFSGFEIRISEGAGLAAYPRPWWDLDSIAPYGSRARASGWPWLSFMGWSVVAYNAREVDHRLLVPQVSGWPRALLGEYGPNSPPQFPYSPIWRGTLLNALFYATVIWLVFCSPSFVRTRIRSWRGQCVRCGYPRGESSTCPECGATLKSASATAA